MWNNIEDDGRQPLGDPEWGGSENARTGHPT